MNNVNSCIFLILTSRTFIVRSFGHYLTFMILLGYSNLEELDTVFKSDMELTLGGRQDSDGVIGRLSEH